MPNPPERRSVHVPVREQPYPRGLVLPRVSISLHQLQITHHTTEAQGDITLLFQDESCEAEKVC